MTSTWSDLYIAPYRWSYGPKVKQGKRVDATCFTSKTCSSSTMWSRGVVGFWRWSPLSILLLGKAPCPHNNTGPTWLSCLIQDHTRELIGSSPEEFRVWLCKWSRASRGVVTRMGHNGCGVEGIVGVTEQGWERDRAWRAQRTMP